MSKGRNVKCSRLESTSPKRFGYPLRSRKQIVAEQVARFVPQIASLVKQVQLYHIQLYDFFIDLF